METRKILGILPSVAVAKVKKLNKEIISKNEEILRSYPNRYKEYI